MRTHLGSAGLPRPVGRSSAGDGLQARWLLGWLGRKEMGSAHENSDCFLSTQNFQKDLN
jgi:hypothetical protein